MNVTAFLVVVNPAPELDRTDDRREVVVQQHERGSFARHVGTTAAHGDADMGRFERRHIVDAVAGHRDDLAVGFQGRHDAQFLLGHYASEDLGIPDAVG